MEAKSREHCKIRKRGNSSSSSSSLVQKYRFKRAILVGKRGGSTTPVPTWMTSTKSPTFVVPNAESTKCPTSQSGGKAKEVSVSARKLAATLWEINKIPSPRVTKDLKLLEDKREFRSREKVAKLPNLSDPSYPPISEVEYLFFLLLGSYTFIYMFLSIDLIKIFVLASFFFFFSFGCDMQRIDRSKGHSHHRRRTSVITKKLNLADYNLGGLDSLSNASLMEVYDMSTFFFLYI